MPSKIVNMIFEVEWTTSAVCEKETEKIQAWPGIKFYSIDCSTKSYESVRIGMFLMSAFSCTFV